MSGRRVVAWLSSRTTCPDRGAGAGRARRAAQRSGVLRSGRVSRRRAARGRRAGPVRQRHVPAAAARLVAADGIQRDAVVIDAQRRVPEPAPRRGRGSLRASAGTHRRSDRADRAQPRRDALLGAGVTVAGAGHPPRVARLPGPGGGGDDERASHLRARPGSAAPQSPPQVPAPPSCSTPTATCRTASASTSTTCAGRCTPTTKVLSIYSRDDPIVRPAACQVRSGENVEVRGSHGGLAHNRAVYPHLARFLAAR